ncbi:MAG: tRNA dihydrouridine synthase DusB [Eubacteriales bacterium]|nr:tRNA dihydrouridine synthase DusB [Eubacteriales bacterium]
MKIGKVLLKNNLIIAPMAGITDRAFREIAMGYGAGLSCSEMISAKALYYGDKKTLELAQISNDDRPISIQIFGSEPDIMAFAADKLSYGDIIDINMGCPAPKIYKNNEGGALLKNPQLIYDIVKAVKGASKVPVTVKMRMGVDHNNITIRECAIAAQEAGADALTLHGRTVDMMYSGSADREIIREVKGLLKIPVIGNGDVKSREDYLSMLNDTGCDGVMVGRALLGSPWVIEEILTGTKMTSNTKKLEVTKKHIELICKYRGEYIGIKEARKHALWYVKGLKFAAQAKRELTTANSLEEMNNLLVNLFLSQS